jgi:hypothetical protein
VRSLIAETVKRFGIIDILVLNAGIVLGNKGLEGTSEADFDTAYAVNVKAPFFLVKVFAYYIYWMRLYVIKLLMNATNVYRRQCRTSLKAVASFFFPHL